jgi:hypothetical protein
MDVDQKSNVEIINKSVSVKGAASITGAISNIKLMKNFKKN